MKSIIKRILREDTIDINYGFDDIESLKDLEDYDSDFEMISQQLEELGFKRTVIYGDPELYKDVNKVFIFKGRIKECWDESRKKIKVVYKPAKNIYVLSTGYCGGGTWGMETIGEFLSYDIIDEVKSILDEFDPLNKINW